MTKEQVIFDLTTKKAIEFSVIDGTPFSPKTVDFASLTTEEQKVIEDAISIVKANTKPTKES